ncbi:MAG: leucine-rich repeat protein [Firmicutes bacterium]|nr:leucine-rich repeat protein [Bacillota bacterium]
MKSKKMVSIVLTAALITSMQTSVFAAEVSNTDTVSASEITTAQETEPSIVDYYQNEESSASGKCGDNLTWTFEKATGVLTISGNGNMYWEQWDFEHNTPWDDYKNEITSVAFNGKITSIYGSAFMGCNNLDSIVIPDTVITIGQYAFRKCQNLQSVSIPDSVTTIEKDAFSECIRLTDITLSNSISAINYHTFYGCVSLRSITIPDSVTVIEEGAFYNCTGLTSVKIPNSVITIGRSSFKGCTNLKDVVVGDSVKTIKQAAFENCTSLKCITLPTSLTTIESSFENCDSLSDVYYKGTEEEWNKINGLNLYRNNAITNANIHFNYVEGKITSVSNVSVSTTVGKAPVLPETVTASYRCGKTAEVAVAWDTIDEKKYSKAGSFDVNGTVENFDGKVTCTVTVTEPTISEITLVSYNKIETTVPAGYVPTLPETVIANYSDGTSKGLPVVWATLGRSSFMTPGKVVEIKGATFEDSALMPNLDNSVVPTAYVTVTKPLVLSINKAEAQTVVGTAPVLPETVTVKLSNDTTAQAKVTWEAISPESYAQVGQFTVNGTIDAEGKDYEYVGEYAGLATVCTVKVTEKSSEQSQDKPADNDNGEVIENVQTGESDTALPMLALIASTFVMAYTLVINKFRKLRENI